MKLIIALIAATAIVPAAASAASSPLTPYVLTDTSYLQDFDSLAASGTSNLLPAGFQIVELGDGAAADGVYAAGTGSSNAGNAYSFGASGSSDRALGSLASGGVSTIYLGGLFTNGLGATITQLDFALTGEQWRAGTSSDDGLFFEYSLDATALDNGSWTALSALDVLPLILSGNTALNGNANSTALSAALTGLAIGAGESFAFRWADYNSSANDHGLAIDNLSIGATLAQSPAVPEPATWAMLTLGFGLLGGTLRAGKRKTRIVFA